MKPQWKFKDAVHGYGFLNALYHWFRQRVLGQIPICRCCDLCGQPIYREPVCEVCQDYNPRLKRRTWR